MFRLFRRNLLPLVILCAVLLAWLAPGIGAALRERGLVAPLIMLTFLLQGAGVDTNELRRSGTYLKVLGWGFFISQALAPLLGFAAVKLLGWQDDTLVGFMLICCVGPTLVSGTVIATAAGGDRSTCLMLTIALNLAAIVLVPLNLRWALGRAVTLDESGLLLKLICLVLLPALLGQLIRRRWPGLVTRRPGLIKNMPIFLLGALIYISISAQIGQLRRISGSELLLLLLPALTVHYLLFGTAWLGGRWLLKLPASVLKALAFVCSQKTIPVAIAVWSATSLREDYPLALLPPIIFHLGQVYGDGLLARFMVGGQEELRTQN